VISITNFFYKHKKGEILGYITRITNHTPFSILLVQFKTRFKTVRFNVKVIYYKTACNQIKLEFILQSYKGIKRDTFVRGSYRYIHQILKEATGRLTCLCFIAFCKSRTTSSPSTPEHLNPFVHVTRRALVSPSWKHGKENVKPSGSCSFSTLNSFMNFAKQSAMWSKSYNWIIHEHY